MSDSQGAVVCSPSSRPVTSQTDYPALSRLRSVGSAQRLAAVSSEGPSPAAHQHQPSGSASASSPPSGSMSKWLLGIAVIAIVAVMHIFSSVNTQAGNDQPISVYNQDSGGNAPGHSTAKPTWASLGRLGHELLTQKEHATKPLPGQVDPYTRAWPNTVAICAIMKDERLEDVKEFIDYHRWVGVDTFYLRENGDECAIKDDLQPYVDAGVLDLELLPGPKHPTQTNWNRAVTEKDSLKWVLRNSFRYTAAVSMQWVLFGSAGHKDMPPEGQLKGFNKCTGVLSKQMKCMGNSYWFHYHSTFRPTHVHQCNFRFGAVAVLGNSEPLNMWRVKMTTGAGTEGPYGASYAGHLSENEHKYFTKITNDYQIVLFHYVTRSQNSFVERKINRRSGVYATTYGELAEKDKDADQDTLYKRFEHEYGFDGEHNICIQGEKISDAMRVGVEEGWRPIPSEPGLLRKTEDSGTSKNFML